MYRREDWGFDSVGHDHEYPRRVVGSEQRRVDDLLLEDAPQGPTRPKTVVLDRGLVYRTGVKGSVSLTGCMGALR